MIQHNFDLSLCCFQLSVAEISLSADVYSETGDGGAFKQTKVTSSSHGVMYVYILGIFFVATFKNLS